MNENAKAEFDRAAEGRRQLEDEHSRDKKEIQDKCEALGLQLEKQKIFVQAHKRDMELAQSDLERVKAECDTRIETVLKEKDQIIDDIKAKLAQQEQTLTQYEVEYNLKADEVD